MSIKKKKGQTYYDKKKNTISVHGWNYEIPVDQFSTSAQVLDWIAQLSGKLWMTDEMLGAFVREVDRVLFLQANYCSMGCDRGKQDAVKIAQSNSEYRERLDGISRERHIYTLAEALKETPHVTT